MSKIFVFIDIWFVKQDIQKWLKTKICNFLWRIRKWKEIWQFFFIFKSGDLNPWFSVIFPPMILIFTWSEEPEIKSKQASKRDGTLKTYKNSRRWLDRGGLSSLLSSRCTNAYFNFVLWENDCSKINRPFWWKWVVQWRYCCWDETKYDQGLGRKSKGRIHERTW